uniref:Uncharacterized protein n=1 Tax=Sphaerodactylus townsendi TaxID=933632 RepID=A0ACB8F829_9SAUR
MPDVRMNIEIAVLEWRASLAWYAVRGRDQPCGPAVKQRHNTYCVAIYSSVSGLKAHLANCNKGDHSVGKYRCLLCQKEFSSESGVKYHIIKTHSENWFRTSTETVPKKKSTEQVVPNSDGQKKTTDGKKRGRKPKERPPEAFFKGKDSTAEKTNHKKTTGSWQTADFNPDGKESNGRPPHSKKGGASKMPEK